jgi:hypothetical protein
MSTRSFLHSARPQSHKGIPPDDVDHWTGPRYRCLYCHKEFKAVEYLPGHEASCEARLIIRRRWAAIIEKAKHAEARTRRG